MKAALRAKLIFHRDRICDELAQTGDRPIVEKSFRDSFWGARPNEKGFMVGRNVLGRLWMELRGELDVNPEAYSDGLDVSSIPFHILLGHCVERIDPSDMIPQGSHQFQLDI